MKSILFTFSLVAFSLSYSQSFPISFDSKVTTSDFIDFDGRTAIFIVNPSKTGINLSDSVARTVRDSGQIWARK